MKRETGKVFLACAIGAGIGSLVALEMIRALWWVGLVVGGLAGYLSYEWSAVLRAIPTAYRAARGWQAPFGYWGFVWWLFAVIFSFVCLFAGILTLAVGSETGWSRAELIKLSYVIQGMFFAALLVTLGMAIANRNVIPDKAVVRSYRQTSYVLFLPIIVFWHLPRGIWWVARRLPRAMIATAVGIARGIVAFTRFSKRFAWELFLRIHSEMRLLCGVDAMLGAAVGYFAGSAIVGALAGGIFGVLNYAVITERWLKPKGYLPIR